MGTIEVMNIPGDERPTPQLAPFSTRKSTRNSTVTVRGGRAFARASLATRVGGPLYLQRYGEWLTGES
jgi:hypothetical protein